VAVTIAKYETPNHNNINKIGIAVDVALPDCKDGISPEVCVADLIEK
jgi:C-terminal processing protease CtpA/Prc